MNIMHYGLIYCMGRFGLYLIDKVIFELTKNAPQLIVTKPKNINSKDYMYLGINSISETIFIIKILNLILHKSIICTSIYKPFVSFYLLFYLDDIGYILLHRILHKFYWLHFHHHKIKIPTRGYIDAGNENPIEMALALIYNYYIIILFNNLIDIPSISIIMHVFAKAIGSCINHLNKDVRINLGFGVVFDSAFHQKHHIHNNCNYAQFCEILG